MKRSRLFQFLGAVLCLAAAALLMGCKPEPATSSAKLPPLDCAIAPNGAVNGGICAGKPVSVTLNGSEPITLSASNFEMAHNNNMLVRVAKVSDQLELFAVDLTNKTTWPISSVPFSEGINGFDIDGSHVVWSTTRNIYAYDLRTKENIQIKTIATDPRPNVSENIVVWDGLLAYDLEKRTPLTITFTMGATRYPRISGNWIIALDTIYDGPEWGHGAKLYARNLKTNEEFLIGEMAMGYGWQGFYAIDAPWIVWLSKPNLENNINDQSKLHVFNLETRVDRIVIPPAVITETRSFPLNLQLDGNVVLYHLGRNLYGYDIVRDVSFPIAKPQFAVGDPIISNDRIIWNTPTDKSFVLAIEQVIRGDATHGGTAQSPIPTPNNMMNPSSPLPTPTRTQ